MRKVSVFITILVLVAGACGDDDNATNTTTTSTTTTATTSTTTTTTTEPSSVTCQRAPGDLDYGEIIDGAIENYPAGRYRVDQIDPIPHFTIEEEWKISDLRFPLCCGFSGLHPKRYAAQEGKGPFVEIWNVTAWYDLTTDTNMVFPPGELAARVQADPRLTDVAVTEVSVGSCPATRIGARVLDEYQRGKFWLGAGLPRDHGDTPLPANYISAGGEAAERVVFWAIDVDGIDLLVNATYPTEHADEFEPILEAFVATMEFEQRVIPDPVLSGSVDGIDIYNATGEQLALVEWAIGRFDTAGLDRPPVSHITFPPTETCASGISGMTYSSTETSNIHICTLSDAFTELTNGPLVARRTTLHELGHAYNAAFIDETTRQAFLALRNLDQWNDEVWQDSGNEQAAEILMWGLIEDPLVQRIPETTCTELHQAYELLTNTTATLRQNDCTNP